jgi:hypothetical protein
MRVFISFFIFLLFLGCSDGKSKVGDEDHFVNDDAETDDISQADNEELNETLNDSDNAATCEHGDVRNCVDFESFERCVDGSWTTISLKHKGLEWSCVRSDCEESSGERIPNIQELRMLIQNCPQTEYPKPSGQDIWCELEDPDHLDSGILCDGCPADSSGKYSVFGGTDLLRSSSELQYYDIIWYVNFYTASIDRHYRTENYSDTRCVR